MGEELGDTTRWSIKQLRGSKQLEVGGVREAGGRWLAEVQVGGVKVLPVPPSLSSSTFYPVRPIVDQMNKGAGLNRLVSLKPITIRWLQILQLHQVLLFNFFLLFMIRDAQAAIPRSSLVT